MKKILIIEDSKISRMYISKPLKDEYEVLWAANATEGLEMVKTQNIDCILCDLLMPEMDGFQFMEQIKKIADNIPIIIVTSDIQNTTRERCASLGAFGFLNKPVNEDELLKTVRKALDKKGKTIFSSKMAPEVIDALTELVNIGIGRAASSLNDLIHSHIQLSVVKVEIYSMKELRGIAQIFTEAPCSSVIQEFKGEFPGKAALVFPKESASKLVSVFTGEEMNTPGLDSVRAGTLMEIGNIVINGVMGSIGNMLNSRMEFLLPDYREDTIWNLILKPELHSTDEILILIAKSHFVIENLKISGDFILVYEVGSFEELVSMIKTRLLGEIKDE